MGAYLFPFLFLGPLLLVPGAPYAGILLWAWVTMMNPHQIAGGWVSTFPINQAVIALMTLGLILRRETLPPVVDGLTAAIVAFVIWSAVTTLAALSPALSAARADLSIKNIIFGLAVAAATRNRVRFQALIWMFVVSYGFFGVKGGGFTILTGGSGQVIGPANTNLEDRNALALVMLLVIPLAYYLCRTSANRVVRLGLLGVMVLNAVAVLGTYSRGGMIGLAFLLSYFWLKSRHKLLVGLCTVTASLACLSVLPEQWFQRMSTVQSADADDSFAGRVDAWHFAINAASSRLLGVGFSGTEDQNVFERYMHDPVATFGRGRAAHSIYFQVLGDHGFIGLGLYLAILAIAWRCAGRLARTTTEGGEWAAEFGRMARVALASYCVGG